MSKRLRIGITVATAVLLGAYTCVTSTDVLLPGALDGIVNSGVFGGVAWGLALLGAFLVYRWWALLPALAPIAVLVFDRNFVGHDIPLREDIFQLSAYNPVFFSVVVIIGTAPRQDHVDRFWLLLPVEYVWLSPASKHTGNYWPG